MVVDAYAQLEAEGYLRPVRGAGTVVARHGGEAEPSADEPRRARPVEIDGHTNQVKVKPKYYPTDWELSAARAVTVLRRLNEVDHIPANRLSETGFGHTKPLEDPSIPGSQKINKRVDIVVLSQAPAETRALYQQVQQDLQKSQHKTGVQP